MNILFISTHADDAELGCGGTISKLYTAKNALYWLSLSAPFGVNFDVSSAEACKAIDVVCGGNQVYFPYNFEARNFPKQRQEILETLLFVKNKINPNIVFGPTSTDFHQDHEVVHSEMIRCFKNSSTILGYEMPWNQMVSKAALYVSLKADDIQNKCKMLSCFKSQHKQRFSYFDSDRVIAEAMANGVVIGEKYAEKFEVIRQIWR